MSTEVADIESQRRYHPLSFSPHLQSRSFARAFICNSLVHCARVLVSHPHDELLDVDLGAGPAKSASFEKRPFPRDQVPMPAQ
jgi:hypothetical protein